MHLFVPRLEFQAPRFWRRLHALLFELGSWGALFSRALVPFCQRRIAILEARGLDIFQHDCD